MGITAAQQAIANQVLAEADKQGATAVQKLALMEAGLVESEMTNLGGGDRDSAGVFQERPSQGWHDVQNVALATDQMLAAFKRSPNQTDAGVMAQFGEKSAFPDKYGKRLADAQALLSGAGPAGAGGAAGSSDGSLTGALDGFIKQYAVKVGLICGGGLLMLVGIWVALGHAAGDLPVVGGLAHAQLPGKSPSKSSGRSSGPSRGRSAHSRGTSSAPSSAESGSASDGGDSGGSSAASFGKGTASVPGPDAIFS